MSDTETVIDWLDLAARNGDGVTLSPKAVNLLNERVQQTRSVAGLDAADVAACVNVVRRMMRVISADSYLTNEPTRVLRDWFGDQVDVAIRAVARIDEQGKAAQDE